MVDMGSQQPPAYGQPVFPPPTHLLGAILVTLFCCMPLGVVSIVFAAQVSGKFEAGDVVGARRSSADAKKWLWIAFGCGVSVWAIYFLLVGVLMIAGAMSN